MGRRHWRKLGRIKKLPRSESPFANGSKSFYIYTWIKKNFTKTFYFYGINNGLIISTKISFINQSLFRSESQLLEMERREK